MTSSLTTRLVAGAAAALTLLYALRLAWATVVAAWKVGWESRPLVHVGIEHALVYVIFAAAVALFTLDLGRRGGDSFLRLTGLFVLGSLGVYWLGLLTGALGIG